MEFSNLARWKLLTLILKLPPLGFVSAVSAFSLDFSKLCSFSVLLIRLLRELNSWPDVRHIVYLRLTSVSLISTLCFWTMSFWMFLSLMSIFSESICLFLIWSLRSFSSRFKWAIKEASWCFCRVSFRFFILSLISRFFSSRSFSSSFSANFFSLSASMYCFCFTSCFSLDRNSITFFEGFKQFSQQFLILYSSTSIYLRCLAFSFSMELKAASSYFSMQSFQAVLKSSSLFCCRELTDITLDFCCIISFCLCLRISLSFISMVFWWAFSASAYMLDSSHFLRQSSSKWRNSTIRQFMRLLCWLESSSASQSRARNSSKVTILSVVKMTRSRRSSLKTWVWVFSRRRRVASCSLMLPCLRLSILLNSSSSSCRSLCSLLI